MLLSYPVYRAVRLAAAAAIALSVPEAAGAQSTARVRDTRLGMLQRWAGAVDVHEPGELDAAVTQIAKLTPVQRGLLMEVAAPFAGLTRDVAASGEWKSEYLKRFKSEERSGVEVLVKRIIAAAPYAAWLHRAVVLETDIAILAPEVTAEAMKNAPAAEIGEAIRAEDGELGARNLLNWHWTFARALLDERDPPASDTFAANWYHAIALFMLDQQLFAELEPHLRKGTVLFLTDGQLAFDFGCLADAFGSRRVQAILISTPVRGQFRPNLPQAQDAYAQAVQRFSRALTLDQNLVEARVRLARIYTEQNRNDDALALLATAFRVPMAPETEYMAHLIAARADGAVSKEAEAIEHLNSARALFPTAQTPVIALSQLALEMGDLQQAAALAGALRAGPAPVDRIDPWWFYFQAPWIDHTMLIEQLRKEARR
jgi:tetratricopeptide (TPR) repeat protein